MKKIIFYLFIPLIISSQVISLDEREFIPFNTPPYLTPTFMPANSIVINYCTKELKTSVVALGIDSSLRDTIRGKEKTHFHHLVLTNLQPNTKYFYQVLPDGKVYQFRTFPIQPDSFYFVVIGDTRTDAITHKAVIERIANYDFDFILHTGDMVTTGYRREDWEEFFNIECKIITCKLFLPVVGNHEKPFWQYDSLFLLPGIEDFYFVRFGNTGIICLNTEIDLAGYQKKWLNNKLEYLRNDTTIHWIFVNLHRPPYSSGSHGSDRKVQQEWCPIFEKYGVDIVFCGHDHAYERTNKINGVIYIITAGGGAPLYNVGNSEWTAYSEKTHHFCLVKVKPHEIFLQAIKPDGTVFDSLRLKK